MTKVRDIIFVWKEFGRTYSKKFDRKSLCKKFEAINDNNNDESGTLPKILLAIESCDEITINKDINQGKDIPFIVSYNDNGTERTVVNIIEVRRLHKQIWNLLDECCMDEFIWKWVSNEEEFEKKMIRQKVYPVFQGLIQGFEDNKHVSELLVEIIPEVKEIMFDKDWEKKNCNPTLEYILKSDSKKKTIEINPKNTVVLSILAKYCDK